MSNEGERKLEVFEATSADNAFDYCMYNDIGKSLGRNIKIKPGRTATMIISYNPADSPKRIIRVPVDILSNNPLTPLTKIILITHRN